MSNLGGTEDELGWQNNLHGLCVGVSNPIEIGGLRPALWARTLRRINGLLVALPFVRHSALVTVLSFPVRAVQRQVAAADVFISLFFRPGRLHVLRYFGAVG